MKKVSRFLLMAVLFLSGFCFIENNRMLCGTWVATVFNGAKANKIGVDTLFLLRNGKFALRKYSTQTLPGIYTGKWQILKDSLVLRAHEGGMLMFDEKGKALTEKLESEHIIKLSITIHSREEIYLSHNTYNFSRINLKNH